MSNLFRIRLELARMEGFPEGSSEHGYVFVAPLTKHSHIDADLWHTVKEKCRVTRFWGNDPVLHGMLRHVGRGWRFDYVVGSQEDDEPFFKLDQHAIKPDNYVSITEQDGVQRPFRIVSVDRITTPEHAS